jgi:hypothetical protein
MCETDNTKMCKISRNSVLITTILLLHYWPLTNEGYVLWGGGAIKKKAFASKQTFHLKMTHLLKRMAMKLNIVPERIRPCDLHKLLNSLKLKKACGIDGILNECLRHLPRRPLVHLTHLINHCIRLSHFLSSWKEAKVVALPKPGKDPKFSQNLRPISLLSSTGKVFGKVI